MTSVHTISSLLTEPLTEATLIVQWSATLSRWTSHNTSHAAPDASHSRLSLQLSLHIKGDRAAVEARTQHTGGEQNVLLSSQIRPCQVCRSDGFIHIDIGNDERSMIKLTIDGTQRLVYARTSLLTETQIAAGLFDPPVLSELHIAGK